MKRIILLTISILQCLAGYSQTNHSDEYLNSLRDKIISLYQTNDLESAYDNVVKYVSLAKKSKTPLFYPDALSFQAEICLKTKQYKHVERTLKLLFALCDKNIEYYQYAKRGFNIQEALYKNTGTQEKIPAMLCRYIDYTYDHFGVESKELADLCGEVTSYIEGYRIEGQYQEAINIITTVIDHFKEQKIFPYMPVSVFLSGLSIMYSDMGMQGEAIETIEEAIQVRKDCMGDAYIINPAFSNNLALAHYKSHNYENAIKYLNEALENVDSFPGASSVEIESFRISVYASLCALYLGVGEFAEAEECGLKAIDISDGAVSYYYLQTLVNMSLLYYETGDLKRSLQYSDIVIPLFVESELTGNILYITTLQNKGAVLSSLGRYEESADCFIEVVDLINRVGENSFLDIRVKIANNLGLLCYNIEEYDKAKGYWDDALRIMESFGIENNPNYVCVLSNLSVLNYVLDDMPAAEILSTKALTYTKERNVPNHLYNMIIGNSILVFEKLRRTEEAKQLLLTYSEGIERQVFANWAFMTNSQREIFWNMQAKKYSYIYCFILNSVNSDSMMIEQAYNSALFSKGLLLSSSIEFKKIILESHDPVAVEKYTALQHAVDSQEKTGKDMSLEIERLEKDLINISKTYGDYTNSLKVRWTDVKNKLLSNDLAIEFVDFGIPDSDSIMYAALLLRHDWDAPKMIKLFKKKEFDRLESTAIKAQAIATHRYKGEYGKAKEISALIWSPLAEYINDGDNVYFSPSGMLHHLAIESLPTEDGRLMSEKYNIYRLSTTKQLCYDHPNQEYDKAVLYGGLTYDLDENVMVAESRTYSTMRDLYATRGFEADTLYRGAGWENLPGTRIEVENISKTLDSQGIKKVLFEGQAGNEESFRALSGERYPIIHIATHGFFLPLQKARKQDYFNLLSDELPMADNSMRRSGLILAGGNKAWQGEPVPEGIEDGVLTAQEILSLDLRGADLVVLSACETGLGEVSGEGVFGLQRAFKKAGAQTLIMSLWKVSDAATETMMSEFYTHFLAGKSKREAFLAAQSSVREKYPEPYYWAAFIMLD